jgi:hypothetical protein
MANPVVTFVEEELKSFRLFSEANPSIFPQQDNLYAIPFFGDIRNAEVLTLALNPARTEFAPERHWFRGLDARALTTRLLHYFDLPEPGPHDWFASLGGGLALLNSSYRTNAAHIDLHAHPTKFKKELSEDQCRKIGGLVQASGKQHLRQALRLAPKAKLILVVDYSFLPPKGGLIKTFDFVRSQESGISELVSEAGENPPIFRAGGLDKFKSRIDARADDLRKHLNDSLPLRLCSAIP